MRLLGVVMAAVGGLVALGMAGNQYMLSEAAESPVCDLKPILYATPHELAAMPQKERVGLITRNQVIIKMNVECMRKRGH